MRVANSPLLWFTLHFPLTPSLHTKPVALEITKGPTLFFKRQSMSLTQNPQR